MKGAWCVPLALALALLPAQAAVRVWQGTLSLPTSVEGAPDPNPPFDVFAIERFNYPYTLRENLSGRSAVHHWRALYLENEYLKCSVLPDLGGHLYTCVDKISGQPMFYANPSIKKANIGYRGAWAAFGIEFNFPVSHNWVSLSPVPFRFAKNADGSASIWVGNIDRVYGMEWLVELRLAPGTTVLDEHVTLYNRSDVRHRFYWWTNAAVEVTDDSRICYPMRYTASHGFTEVDTWPVDRTGKDLSLIRNQTDGPVSRFVHGSREPFMGIWRPDTATGTVHYAAYAELPAKKIWSWGVDADGRDWRRTLSDNDSAYAEVQAGLFRNQETYAFLEPRQTIRFTEAWMPARGIGGIARANLAGVLNLSRRAGTLVAAFNANRQFPRASLRIAQGARLLAAEKTDLAPERTWTREIQDVSQDPCTFELRDALGRTLLLHTEGQYDWTPAAQIQTGPQSRHLIPKASDRTADDWLGAGTEEELQGALLTALRTYHDGLDRFPDHFGLHLAAGRLAATLLRYSEAVQYLEGPAAQAPANPEIAYYLGLAYEGNGDNAKAQTAYQNAARAPSFRLAADLKLGELWARTGHRQDALPLLRSAAKDDPRAAEESIALEHSPRQNRPLSLFLLWDAAPGRDPHLLRLLAADPERVLEIAAEYMRLGLYRPALDLLSRDFLIPNPDETEPGAVPVQQYLLVAYYRARCREKLGESPDADSAAGSQLSTLYVFPTRAEDLEVLRAAVGRTPRDMTARYLLGTLYFSRGLTDDALTQWNVARQAGTPIPVLHADIGQLLLRERHDPLAALRVFQEGLRLDPRNVKLYEGEDQALSLMGRPARELAVSLEHYPDPREMPAGLAYELALERAEGQEFNGAAAAFREHFFAREEGGTNVRQVWVEVKTLEALSLAAGGRCQAALGNLDGMGAPVPELPFTKDGIEPFVAAPRIQYLFAQIERHCGRPAQAHERCRRIATAGSTGDLVWAWGAAKHLEAYDPTAWRLRLESALAQADATVEPYTLGTLEAALGKRSAAWSHFQQALLLPDRRMSHHLARMAMHGNALPQ
jgi:Flp pilus assembly protein TadD